MRDEDIAVYIILSIVAFIIAIFITRAIFSIGTIVNNLRAQTRLLMKIAEKQGVSKDDLEMAQLELKRQ